MFKADLSKATVVTLYLLQRINLALRPRLRRELRSGTRLVSQSFDMGQWEPASIVVVESKLLFLWIL
jgi:hypothetical protein